MSFIRTWNLFKSQMLHKERRWERKPSINHHIARLLHVQQLRSAKAQRYRERSSRGDKDLIMKERKTWKRRRRNTKGREQLVMTCSVAEKEPERLDAYWVSWSTFVRVWSRLKLRRQSTVFGEKVDTVFPAGVLASVCMVQHKCVLSTLVLSKKTDRYKWKQG